MRICAVLAALIAVSFAPITAQGIIDLHKLPDELRPICARVQNSPIPVADLPTADDRARLKGCNPLLLYRGDPNDTKGLTPNFIDARKCAYLAQAEDFMWTKYYTVTGAPAGDQGVTDEPLEALSLIYANGKGVQQNFDLAFRFVCEKGSRYEVNDEIRSLIKVESRGGSYDGICEEASPIFNPCAGVDLVPKWQEYNRELTAFTAQFSEKERQVFDSLKQADEAYFWLDHPEFDTSQDMSQPDYDLEMHSDFLGALEAADTKPPHFSTEDFRAADAALNRAYRQAIEASDGYFKKGGSDTEEPKADRIRDTERAWLKEREAWVAFGSLKWPRVSHDSWRTLLTQQRTDELEELAQELRSAH